MFFTIGYKTIWLAFVAVPLWQAGTLWGTPSGEIAGFVSRAAVAGGGGAVGLRVEDVFCVATANG